MVSPHFLLETVMLKIELLTAREHVAWVWIPPFKKLPEVLIWGSRVFTLKDATQAQLYSNALRYQIEYEEAFAYYVPPGFDEINYKPERFT